GMAKDIGDGNFAVENRIKSSDELEELGLFFSKMARKLNEYYNNLEQKIAERTKELNIKNDYLNKTKIATINILEDVEAERNKTVELAKNLEKFKLALDNASDLIVITDAEGTVLYGNNGVFKLTGYTLTEALGKKAGYLWGKIMPAAYYQKMWKTIKEDKKTFDGDIKNKRKNGEIYDAKITISPVLNNKKEVEFFIGIQRDVTHEKMVDAAKTEFVSLASHQLRTPLSSINWYAEMLLAGDGGPLNDEQKNFVEEIYTGNQRMVDLVNSLLNVSRLELGTFAVDPEPTDIIATAQSVLNELKPGVISKELIVDFKHDQEIPIIQADPKLIRIIFQNLLSNAIKYTPTKGTVSLKVDKDTKNLLIEVADTGYGIPQKDQARIFEKLFRAENVREKDTEGTGLGLYIVKSIINHAGGKITFKSEENKGTTFSLEIPLSGMKKKKGDKKIE
ncbi:MAG: ATP-binding protein, partial [Patescibacteria group bacterium]